MGNTIPVDQERYEQDQRLLELYQSLLPYGSMDLQTAAGWLEHATIDFGDFGDYVTEFCKDTGMAMKDLDIAALVLEYIPSEAHADELREYVARNFYCSTYNISEDKAGEILYAVPEDERNDAWEWLVDFTDAAEPAKEEEAE